MNKPAVDFQPALRLAPRVRDIKPFLAMEVMKAAALLVRSGVDVIQMGIGEPDFTAPQSVVDAATSALHGGRTGYTDASGLPALRSAIARHYQDALGATIQPNRILVTAGASAGLLLACAALVADGDEFLMPDPCYPCNRHFVSAYGGKPVLVPTTADARFQMTAQDIATTWGERTRGIIVASPSNPTGTSMAKGQLQELLGAVKGRGGAAIIDEIYQGLCYDAPPVTSLSFDDDAITVNSFSKYFNMTGWRLGWIVAPEVLMPEFEKLAQNLFICPSTIAQYAALACFEPEALAIYEARRLEFKKRRDFLVPNLRQLGFKIPVVPDGAFYVYADCREVNHPASHDSRLFAQSILQEIGVAIVPGEDFGKVDAMKYVRFSYTTPYPRLEEAVTRMRRLFNA
jgi:aspartate/methionine/tyrosine aminotransferase